MTEGVTKKEVFSGKEAARYLKLAEPTFRRALREGLPHRRVGRRVLIHKAALDAWLLGGTPRPEAEQ